MFYAEVVNIAVAGDEVTSSGVAADAARERGVACWYAICRQLLRQGGDLLKIAEIGEG